MIYAADYKLRNFPFKHFPSQFCLFYFRSLFHISTQTFKLTISHSLANQPSWTGFYCAVTIFKSELISLRISIYIFLAVVTFEVFPSYVKAGRGCTSQWELSKLTCQVAGVPISTRRYKMLYFHSDCHPTLIPVLYDRDVEGSYKTYIGVCETSYFEMVSHNIFGKRKYSLVPDFLT